jgi:hypothetical protein
MSSSIFFFFSSRHSSYSPFLLISFLSCLLAFWLSCFFFFFFLAIGMYRLKERLGKHVISNSQIYASVGKENHQTWRHASINHLVAATVNKGETRTLSQNIKARAISGQKPGPHRVPTAAELVLLRMMDGRGGTRGVFSRRNALAVEAAELGYLLVDGGRVPPFWAGYSDEAEVRLQLEDAEGQSRLD